MHFFLTENITFFLYSKKILLTPIFLLVVKIYKSLVSVEQCVFIVYTTHAFYIHV